MHLFGKILRGLFLAVLLSIFSFFIIIGFPIFVLTTIFSLSVTGTRITLNLIQRKLRKRSAASDAHEEQSKYGALI